MRRVDGDELDCTLQGGEEHHEQLVRGSREGVPVGGVTADLILDNAANRHALTLAARLERGFARERDDERERDAGTNARGTLPAVRHPVLLKRSWPTRP